MNDEYVESERFVTTMFRNYNLMKLHSLENTLFLKMQMIYNKMIVKGKDVDKQRNMFGLLL